MNSDQIITGEKFQQLANVYLGDVDDFHYNPRIARETHKHKLITDISDTYDNPPVVFFYTHKVKKMASIIHYFKNPFILLSHNSDWNVVESEDTKTILECLNLKKWYTQNLCFQHPKISMIPIGFANSMWPHGNLSLFDNKAFLSQLSNKTQKVYFNFAIHTNGKLRQPCYDALCRKLPWLPVFPPINNLIRLKEYEFCICPEGNGVDCHRFWEALYLKSVPIVIKSPFIETLKRHDIPLVILDRWEDLDIEKLNYSAYHFDNYTFDKFMM